MNVQPNSINIVSLSDSFEKLKPTLQEIELHPKIFGPAASFRAKSILSKDKLSLTELFILKTGLQECVDKLTEFKTPLPLASDIYVSLSQNGERSLAAICKALGIINEVSKRDDDFSLLAGIKG